MEAVEVSVVPSEPPHHHGVPFSVRNTRMEEAEDVCPPNGPRSLVGSSGKVGSQLGFMLSEVVVVVVVVVVVASAVVVVPSVETSTSVAGGSS